ncbi:MAG: hypothetical protein RJA44_1574 [Pseudomonadota bacterium]
MVILIAALVLLASIAGLDWAARRGPDPLDELRFIRLAVLFWLISSAALELAFAPVSAERSLAGIVDDLKISLLMQAAGFFVPCMAVYGMIESATSLKVRWINFVFLAFIDAVISIVVSFATYCAVKPSC